MDTDKVYAVQCPHCNKVVTTLYREHTTKVTTRNSIYISTRMNAESITGCDVCAFELSDWTNEKKGPAYYICPHCNHKMKKIDKYLKVVNEQEVENAHNPNEVDY